MSQGNVEIVRRAYVYFNREGEADFGVFDPEVVVDNLSATFDPDVYYGHDGLQKWLSLLRGMWERQHYDPQELIPAGDHQVIVPTQITSIGRDGVKTTAQVTASFTLRDGRVTHLRVFQTRAEALEAAALDK